MLKKVFILIFLWISVSAKDLVLSYNNQGDGGFGAQYNRILAVYCICKEYGFKYLHSPIKNIHYQGILNLEKNVLSQSFIDRCNEKIFIPSDISLKKLKHYKTIKQNLPLHLLKKQNKALVLYLSPLQITKKNTDLYRHAKSLYKPQIKKNKTFTIGMHVRRGDLLIYNQQDMLDNDYYLNIAQKIIEMCKSCEMDYLVELYTEAPTKKTLITQSHAGMPTNHQIADTYIDIEQNKLHEFDSLSNLHKYVNTDLFETFDRMINCDILIASRSNLSSCASYFKRGITLYYPCWCQFLKKDISSQDPKWQEKILHFLQTQQ